MEGYGGPDKPSPPISGNALTVGRGIRKTKLLHSIEHLQINSAAIFQVNGL